MKYYPIQLDIAGKRCLVVGAGSVGTRKIDGLLACGADVTVVSIATTRHVDALAHDGRVTCYHRAYRADDLDGIFLVIGATNDVALNRQVYEDAGDRNVLCNIADQPALCHFILPAVVRRGDLVIAVSTSGQSPALAKHMRRKMEKTYGEEYALFLRLMGRIRKKLLAADHAPEAHKPLFNALIDNGLLEMIREKRYQDMDALLADVLGTEFDWKSLMAESVNRN